MLYIDLLSGTSDHHKSLRVKLLLLPELVIPSMTREHDSTTAFPSRIPPSELQATERFQGCWALLTQLFCICKGAESVLGGLPEELGVLVAHNPFKQCHSPETLLPPYSEPEVSRPLSLTYLCMHCKDFNCTTSRK